MEEEDEYDMEEDDEVQMLRERLKVLRDIPPAIRTYRHKRECKNIHNKISVHKAKEDKRRNLCEKCSNIRKSRGNRGQGSSHC